jgi:hypothetical protein
MQLSKIEGSTFVANLSAMSMTEILDELPRLSLAERRALSRKLNELEAERGDIESCEVIAAEGFALLDQMEAEDEAYARRP